MLEDGLGKYTKHNWRVPLFRFDQYLNTIEDPVQGPHASRSSKRMLCSFVKDGRKYFLKTHRAIQGTINMNKFVPHVNYRGYELAYRSDWSNYVQFEAINMHIIDAYAKRKLEGLKPGCQRYEMALRMGELLKLVPEVELLEWRDNYSPSYFTCSAGRIYEVLVASRLYTNIGTITKQLPDFVSPDTKLEEACQAAARFHRAVLARDTLNGILGDLQEFEAVCMRVDREKAIEYLYSIIKKESQNRIFAVMMGRHARLGARSPLRVFPPELLQIIAKEAVQEDDLDYVEPIEFKGYVPGLIK